MSSRSRRPIRRVSSICIRRITGSTAISAQRTMRRAPSLRASARLRSWQSTWRARKVDAMHALKETDQALDLADAGLLRMQAFLGGEWTDAESGATRDVLNPATGRRLGTVPNMGAAETRRAIEAASAALPAWAKKTAQERAVILRRWYELMMAHQDDLARIMTAEQGKPLAEARGEIGYAASFIEWFGEEGKRLYGDVIPAHQSDKRIVVLRQPVGVVAAITPWNFPAAMIARKVAPALAAGCTFVCKPATQTPYSALAMAELAARAGIPAGVFNIVTGAGAAAIR